MRFLFGASEKNPLIKRRIGKHSVADQGKKAMPFDRKTWQREKKNAHTHTYYASTRGSAAVRCVFACFFPSHCLLFEFDHFLISKVFLICYKYMCK